MSCDVGKATEGLENDLMKNCFLNTGGVNIGGRRIKCIRFVDMALLAENERMLKYILRWKKNSLA